MGHAPAPSFSGCLVEAGVLPSRWFCCPPLSGTVTPSDFLPPLSPFGFHLIEPSLSAGRISQVACSAFPAFRSPYAGGFAPLIPESQSGIMAFAGINAARHPLAPFGVPFTTRQDSLDVADCWIVPPLKGVYDPVSKHQLSSIPWGLTSRLSGDYLVRTWVRPSSAHSLTCWLYKPSLARFTQRAIFIH